MIYYWTKNQTQFDNIIQLLNLPLDSKDFLIFAENTVIAVDENQTKILKYDAPELADNLIIEINSIKKQVKSIEIPPSLTLFLLIVILLLILAI